MQQKIVPLQITPALTKVIFYSESSVHIIAFVCETLYFFGKRLLEYRRTNYVEKSPALYHRRRRRTRRKVEEEYNIIQLWTFQQV